MPMGEASKRRKESRYKTWFLQDFTEAPSIAPPPWDTPLWESADSREVKGFFRQDQSEESLVAATQGINTRGRFACHPSENIKHGDVLRSAEMNIFIRLEGDSLITSEFAGAQVKIFAARVTSRVTEEQAAQFPKIPGVFQEVDTL